MAVNIACLRPRLAAVAPGRTAAAPPIPHIGMRGFPISPMLLLREHQPVGPRTFVPSHISTAWPQWRSPTATALCGITERAAVFYPREGARRKEERAAHYGWDVTCGREPEELGVTVRHVWAGAATLQVRPAGVGAVARARPRRPGLSLFRPGWTGNPPWGMGGAAAGLPPHYSSVDEPAWSGNLARMGHK